MTIFKPLLILLFISLINLINAQNPFQKGYFINNEGTKTDCLIRNKDWKNNPDRIEYKTNAEGPSAIVTIEGIQEFGIENGVKFVRAFISIDRSSERTDKISYNKNPAFKREQHLLKVLLEGQAGLYVYEEVDLTRFFFRFEEGGQIEQLVYKSYRTADSRIAKNEQYKLKLWENLKCDAITLNDIQNLEYVKQDLLLFFAKYHECNKQDFSVFDQKTKKDLFNLNLRPGMRFSSLAINGPTTFSRDVNFGNKLEVRFGLEAEIFMPISNNRYAILIEPTIHSFQGEKTVDLQTVKVDYTSLEIPLGLRHYFFLGAQSKLMLNASVIFEFPMSSIVDYENSADIDIRSDSNIAIGVGYKYKDKFSLELRYGFERFLRDISFVSDRGYKTLELILGYAVF